MKRENVSTDVAWDWFAWKPSLLQTYRIYSSIKWLRLFIKYKVGQIMNFFFACMGLVTWHRNECFASLDFVSMFFWPGKGSKCMKNEIEYDIYTRIEMYMGSLKRKILRNSIGCRRCLCLLCTIQDNNNQERNPI